MTDTGWFWQQEQAEQAYAAHLAAQGVDWDEWRKCPGCRAKIGDACYSLSGTIVGGRPDGVRTLLNRPHKSRRRRVRRARAGGRA